MLGAEAVALLLSTVLLARTPATVVADAAAVTVAAGQQAADRVRQPIGPMTKGLRGRWLGG